MKRFILYVLILFAFITKETPPKKENAGGFDLLNDRQLCEIVCYSRGLTCVGVLDKTVYDGKTEKSKVLSKQTFSICLQYPEESNPT